ncbi:MAG: peptide chain release factor N(5)-glutamine methyltransferase [Bacteriovoracaceae bacterium]
MERFLREVSDLSGGNLAVSVYSFSAKALKDLETQFLSGMPFQYLLKESEFFGQRLFVNENVLIPRPETEHLVDMIVRSKKKFSTALDIGTGSGAIILSLIKAGVAGKGTGSDISREALAVARINQRRLRLSDHTEFVHADRFEGIHGKFDLIVTNPPYIRATAHRPLVHEKVDWHEPHIALYLQDSSFESWFHELFCGVLKHLSPGGEFWMEGHENELQGQSIALERLGFTDVKVLKDLSGMDRFIFAKSPV